MFLILYQKFYSHKATNTVVRKMIFNLAKSKPLNQLLKVSKYEFHADGKKGIFADSFLSVNWGCCIKKVIGWCWSVFEWSQLPMIRLQHQLVTAAISRFAGRGCVVSIKSVKKSERQAVFWKIRNRVSGNVANGAKFCLLGKKTFQW